jgi:hypothetical protein
MAASPRWKLYTASGEYEASAKNPETLAAAIGILGEGATIRDGHSKVVWTEGKENDGIAFESYDAVANKCFSA